MKTLILVLAGFVLPTAIATAAFGGEFRGVSFFDIDLGDMRTGASGGGSATVAIQPGK